MPKVKVNGIDLYYEIHGKGEPLVLITGYACDSSQWAQVLPLFAKHFTVLIFDNRGAGRSDSPDIPYDVEMMADDLVGILDEVKFGTCHVLGHSLGGSIAQQLAYSYPERVKKLIIANSCAKFSPISKMVSSFFVKLRELGVADENILEGMAPWLFSSAFLERSENVAEIANATLRNPYHQSLEGQKRQLEALINFDSTAWLPEIEAPTLVIGGEEDLLCPQKELFGLTMGIKESHLFFFDEQGHVPLIEQPAEFAQVAIDFLTRES